MQTNRAKIKGLKNQFSNLLVVAFLLSLISVGGPVAEEASPEVPSITEEMLLNSQDDTDNWLMYGRNYRSWRYSPLEQINTKNVKKLVPKWAFQTGVFGGGFECTPIVVDGVMYITTPNSHIFAINARTGKEIGDTTIRCPTTWQSVAAWLIGELPSEAIKCFGQPLTHICSP